MRSLDGSIAVVTGGASGIGRAAATALADRGAAVVIGDIEPDGGRETVELIRDAGGEARSLEMDVTDDDDVNELVETAVATYGGLDIAFNNAGIPSARNHLAEFPEEDWRRIVETNLGGVWRSLKHELRYMADRGEGSIVNNASIFGRVGFPGSGGYVAAKHGVVGLTKAAALEYADRGIRVNAVCPGFVNTPFIDAGGILDDEQARERIEGLHPLARLGDPAEIASAVVWLASEEASFVTGHALPVDGGYLAR